MVHQQNYVVVCLNDNGIYVEATSQHFTNHAEALQYATTVADARRALVYPLHEGPPVIDAVEAYERASSGE